MQPLFFERKVVGGQNKMHTHKQKQTIRTEIETSSLRNRIAYQMYNLGYDMLEEKRKVTVNSLLDNYSWWEINDGVNGNG